MACLVSMYSLPLDTEILKNSQIRKTLLFCILLMKILLFSLVPKAAALAVNFLFFFFKVDILERNSTLTRKGCAVMLLQVQNG